MMESFAKNWLSTPTVSGNGTGSPPPPEKLLPGSLARKRLAEDARNSESRKVSKEVN